MTKKFKYAIRILRDEIEQINTSLCIWKWNGFNDDYEIDKAFKTQLMEAIKILESEG